MISAAKTKTNLPSAMTHVITYRERTHETDIMPNYVLFVLKKNDVLVRLV